MNINTLDIGHLSETNLRSPKHSMFLSIVMPCLNEAETLATCIRKAIASLRNSGLEGEVVIADNGSTDGSQEIAIREGARLVTVHEKGYGNALRSGINAAQGPWVLMGDADDSYDFSRLNGFIEKLREGYELVMGCRLPSGGGTILKGAMPWKHRWIGNPVLTFTGRVFFQSAMHDFHCGLRAITKEAYHRLDLQTTGMEFASEMIIRATLEKMRIAEVPVTLHPDGRSRPPHLRSWRDGWRHLRFMLLFSPRWLFLAPGLMLSAAGFSGMLALAFGALKLGKVMLDVGTLMAFAMMLLVGTQILWFAVFTRTFAVAEGLLPPQMRLKRILDRTTLEWGLLIGILLMASGGGLFLQAFLDWRAAGFGEISYADNMRSIIPASTLILLGIQNVFGSFFMGVLTLKRRVTSQRLKC
jgi:glycosyltransferase involved in cell wall biosynthesis